MASTELGTNTEFEVSAEEYTGIGLHMQLLSSQRSEERHRDHCDYLLDAIDEQLDQLQPRPTLKNSQKNADENSKFGTSEVFNAGSKDHSEDLKTMDSSLKEEKAGVTQYKHIAGIPLKSFDTVTVDSDLDSVTTERVRDHIRKARGIRKGHADSGHSTRRLHRNHNERLRYTASSKMSKDDDDDEEEFERTIAGTQWRSGSTKQWTSSPNKAPESITRAISSDCQDSPDQAQYRRAIEDLATERVLLEESAAKLRRDAILEEERLTKKKAQCREADLSLNDLLLQKKEAYLELESLRDLLERTRNEAVRMETHVRETQMAEESLRSELVLLEYKHSDYLKELKELEMELDSIKQQCSSAHSGQISNLKYEISSLTNERDELKARLRHTEGSLTFMERQELERQLSNAKSELFSEQRTTRAKIVKLEENLEESQCKLEEKITECAEKQEKNKLLKSQLRELEKKYESQIQKQEEEASEHNEAFNQQVTELSSQVREQNTRIASLEKILSEKELDLLRLRDVISSLKAEKEAHVFAAEALKEEQNKRVLDLQQQHQQDKDRQLAELKEQMHCQKQMEIQQFAENMEQVKIKALQDQAESLRKETDKALKTLEGKDKEIAKLKETLKSQKESMKKLAAELKQEAREMVHNTLLREQKKWEGEKKDALQIQRHTLEEQKLQDMADLREALENEHRMVMTLERKLADLQNEIQEHEIHKRSLLRENQEALDGLRTVLKEEKQQELMKLQQELSQDRDRDLERLKIRLQQMEEEQHVLRAEKNEAVFREREALAQTERAERALARDITAECEHIMNTTGRPRTQSPSRSRSQSCLSTNQALQMLHGVNEENNQFIHELQQEVEAQKRTVIHVQREKERELQQLKEQLQMDKEKALSLLKERLIQEHIEEITNMQRDQLRGSNGPDGQSLRQQLREKDNELRAIQRNMAKWKEETATKLAQKFEEELNVELEKSLSRSKASESHRYTERVGSGVCRLSGINQDRRENSSHLRSASTPSLNGVSVQHDFGALKILRNLQGRVRELRADRRVYRGASMEDLSMLRSDLGNSLIEKRPLMPDRCMTPLQGRSIRK
ncbi:trichohyalin-like [Pelobates fuscus]|uniref:trichohyalin-like n=1 Tax=Pelobates fuscus TaxID=191477 RepID=UPI002FE491BC